MAKPEPARAGRGSEPGGMARVEFLMPIAWRDALAGIASRQAISLSDVLRIMVRGFMRERLTAEQLAALDVD